MPKSIYSGGSFELEEKKSRFIAHIEPVTTEDEATNFIQTMKKQYYDARHNCYAFVIGDNSEIVRSSDDGEPSGTAGRPILEVLTAEGVTNAVCVVTRYFGGTLLGTGGLVKAYGDSTKEVLKIVKTEELIERESFTAVMQYDHYTLAKRLLDETTATDITEDFGVGITIKGKIPLSMHDILQKGFQNIGQGRIQLTFQS